MSGERYRVAVSARSIRDVSIPLGAYANVYATFAAPISGRRVRSSPPVLLPRHGAVVLPSAAAATPADFTCAESELFERLSSEPLHLSLIHI